MPLMAGAQFVIDDNLISMVKEKFEVNENDDESTMDTKKLRRDAYMVLMYKSEASEGCL
jgi:hypothetical protein